VLRASASCSNRVNVVGGLISGGRALWITVRIGRLSSRLLGISSLEFPQPMAVCNMKFIHANVLRPPELRVGPEVIFSANVGKVIETWKPVLRMDSLSSSIALFNIVATTLQFSAVCRTADGRCRVPLNLYNIIVARSCTRSKHCCHCCLVVYPISFSVWKE
jgi:hypothetical protein